MLRARHVVLRTAEPRSGGSGAALVDQTRQVAEAHTAGDHGGSTDDQERLVRRGAGLGELALVLLGSGDVLGRVILLDGAAAALGVGVEPTAGGATLVHTLDAAALVGATFVRTALVGATFVGATLIGATFVRATLVRATFVGATLIGATFVRATLVGTALVGTALVGATLIGATFVRTALVRATFVGATFVRATLVAAALGALDKADDAAVSATGDADDAVLLRSRLRGLLRRVVRRSGSDDSERGPRGEDRRRGHARHVGPGLGTGHVSTTPCSCSFE
ncbi:pentapeptide repeat-containing protein [Streptomyces sp. SBT349]|uniref:pentapeptide repeat-containing protein n=1 Tax=Streptomyces sp. SBT349 TaxID=1580539 RepID=UPI00099BBFCC